MTDFGTTRNNRPNTYVAGARARAADVNENEQFLEQHRSFDDVLIVDGSGTAGIDCDYTSIQAAIDRADSDNIGYTIFVKKGSYDENLVIDQDGITIIGENKTDTIILGNDAAVAVIINADYVTIKNTKISKTTNNNNCIAIDGRSHILIENNILVSDQIATMINYIPDTDVGTFRNIRIRNNYLTNSATNCLDIIKIYQYSATGAVNSEIRGFWIRDNYIYVSGTLADDNSGIMCYASTGTATTRSDIKEILIKGNNIVINNAAGGTCYLIRLRIANNANCVIKRVTINSNVGLSSGGANDYGIYLESSASGTLSEISIGTGNRFEVDANKEIRLSATEPTKFSTGGHWVTAPTPTLGTAIGGGTLSGRYSIIGKILHYQLSASAAITGSGTISLNLINSADCPGFGYIASGIDDSMNSRTAYIDDGTDDIIVPTSPNPTVWTFFYEIN